MKRSYYEAFGKYHRRLSSGRKWTTERYMANIAGSTLGFLHGNVGGAIMGSYAADTGYLLTHPNKMHTPRTPGSASAAIPYAPTTDRPGRRAHGRKAVKFSSNGSKIHVSKSLRKKITKVIEDKKVHGSVKQIYLGVIGAIDDLTTNNMTIGGLTSMNAVKYTPDTQYFWQSMIQVGPGPGDAKSLPDGIDFRLFSPYRILDAASVLWNRKVPDHNYNLQTDNLTNATNIDGVPVYTGAPTGMTGPQIMLKSAKATFLLKNNSMRTHFIKMYICKAKRKWVEESPLDTFLDAVATDNAILTTNQLNDADTVFFGPTTTSSGVQPINSFTIVGATPNISKKFSSVYQYETVDITLEPGQSTVQVVHGPRNQMYDWSKMWDGDALKDIYPDPKFDRWVFFSGNLDIVNDTTGYATHGYGTYSADGELRPVNLEMTLDYVLEMPEITGFAQNTQAATAGRAQPLGFRRPRKALLNFTNYLARNHTAVTRIDDQNPCTPCPTA